MSTRSKHKGQRNVANGTTNTTRYLEFACQVEPRLSPSGAIAGEGMGPNFIYREHNMRSPSPRHVRAASLPSMSSKDHCPSSWLFLSLRPATMRRRRRWSVLRYAVEPSGPLCDFTSGYDTSKQLHPTFDPLGVTDVTYKLRSCRRRRGGRSRARTRCRRIALRTKHNHVQTDEEIATSPIFVPSARREMFWTE